LKERSRGYLRYQAQIFFRGAQNFGNFAHYVYTKIKKLKKLD